MPTHCRDFVGMVELGEHPLRTFPFLDRVSKARIGHSEEEPMGETSAQMQLGSDHATVPRFGAVSSTVPLTQYGLRFQWPSHPTVPCRGSVCLLADVDQLITELEAEVESLLLDEAPMLESVGAK